MSKTFLISMGSSPRHCLASKNLAFAVKTEANCSITNGPAQGDVIGKCKKSPNAKWCDMRTTLTPDVAFSWKERAGFTDPRRMAVDGFQKKDEVFAQMRCCNGHSKSDWSQTVSVTIGPH